MMVSSEISVNGNTKIMGVIGDPIAQIKTPKAINPIFSQRGANIVCLPFHIGADDLAAIWAGLKAMKNFVGMGVTLPHKMAVVELCDSVDELAEQVGAVNVVRRELDGSLRGYQFDGPGFVRGLMSQGHRIEGRECLLIGAGGAATAIAFSLVQAGVSKLTISNRTSEKAKEMARQINDRFGPERAKAGAARPASGQIVVHATSLGMRADDPSPIDVRQIDGSMLVAEVVAQPEMTPLLVSAQERGAQVHSGMHMIRNQVDLIAEHLMQLWH